MNTQINIIIPEKLRYMRRDGGYPAIYLLHGLADDNSSWCRFTSIERYAEEKGIIVIMPWAGKSYYTDMKYGDKVFTYVTGELPQFCEKMFPVSSKREDRFVAGISMGGYGALKLALSKPGFYAAAASLSGTVDIAALMARVKDTDIYTTKNPYAIYGLERTPSTERDDLFAMLNNLVRENVDLPEIYMICGTEDYVYNDNVKFANYLTELGVNAQIRWESGKHEWAFWDSYIQEVLKWLPVKK
jgi:S-formylglutathione hydrolase FrmB